MISLTFDGIEYGKSYAFSKSVKLFTLQGFQLHDVFDTQCMYCTLFACRVCSYSVWLKLFFKGSDGIRKQNHFLINAYDWLHSNWFIIFLKKIVKQRQFVVIKLK